MGVRASQYAQIQGVGDDQVIAVFGPAGNDSGAVDAAGRFSDISVL